MSQVKEYIESSFIPDDFVPAQPLGDKASEFMQVGEWLHNFPGAFATYIVDGPDALRFVSTLADRGQLNRHSRFSVAFSLVVSESVKKGGKFISLHREGNVLVRVDGLNLASFSEPIFNFIGVCRSSIKWHGATKFYQVRGEYDANRKRGWLTFYGEEPHILHREDELCKLKLPAEYNF